MSGIKLHFLLAMDEADFICIYPMPSPLQYKTTSTSHIAGIYRGVAMDYRRGPHSRHQRMSTNSTSSSAIFSLSIQVSKFDDQIVRNFGPRWYEL